LADAFLGADFLAVSDFLGVAFFFGAWGVVVDNGCVIVEWLIMHDETNE
jgi:hypothetical protein